MHRAERLEHIGHRARDRHNVTLGRVNGCPCYPLEGRVDRLLQQLLAGVGEGEALRGRRGPTERPGWTGRAPWGYKQPSCGLSPRLPASPMAPQTEYDSPSGARLYILVIHLAERVDAKRAQGGRDGRRGTMAAAATSSRRMPKTVSLRCCSFQASNCLEHLRRAKCLFSSEAVVREERGRVARDVVHPAPHAARASMNQCALTRRPTGPVELGIDAPRAKSRKQCERHCRCPRNM